MDPTSRKAVEAIDELRIDPLRAVRVEHPEPDLWVDLDAPGGYSDVDASGEADILREMKAERWTDVVARRFALQNPWLHRIITDRGRSLFLDFLPLAAGGRFLDVGSGWGQVAVPLSRFGRVSCLDVSRGRIEILREIARQEGVRLECVVGDFRTFPFGEEQFDLVIFNGSLEWIALGAPDIGIREAQQAALAKALRLLRPGGLVYVGIENALGLKYLLGAPDDHTGIPHLTFLDEASAAALYAQSHEGEPLRAKTWSLGEYRTLLASAGFETLQAYACFPDYKLIRAMVPLETVNAYLADVGLPCAEHSGSDGSELPFNAALGPIYRLMAKNGVAEYFCPSYGLVGAKPR